MWTSNNLFLNGPFAPWRQEGDAFDLDVEGKIPPELEGALYRVTPSQHYRPLDPDRHHFFDGDGMIHRVSIANGRADYRNRYVATAGLMAERRAGRALYGAFSTGSDASAVEKAGGPPFKNPGNTNTTLFAGRLLVFCELDLPHLLDTESLETLGLYDFDGQVSGPVTAHFKTDPATGDLLFYGAAGPEIRFYQANAEGKILKTFAFDMGLPSLMHDFLVTPNYAIFCINPTVLNFAGMGRGEPSMIWDVSVGNRFAIMNRHNGEVRMIALDDIFAPTHWLNAYEDGARLVIDGNWAEQLGTRPEKLSAPWTAEEWFVPSHARRWVVDLQTDRVSVTTPFDRVCEFPRMNDQLTGQKHRYGYYVGATGADWAKVVGFECLYKHDFETGRTGMHVVDGLTAPSEVMFAPRPGGKTEDDGWVLAYWWNKDRDVSELVITDAREFEGPPVARIKLNNRVPLGFHGNWVAR